MLYEIGVFKVSQDLQENTTVLESIFKFILRFILSLFYRCLPANFANILKEPFYRTPPDACFCSSSFDISFIGIWNIWKVSLLVTVHPFLLKLFPIDLLIFFGIFLIVREMIFRLMIFNTLIHYCYLSSSCF